MIKTLLLTFVVALLVGCAPTLVPHIAYLPVIREKGQAEARVSTGFNGSELQVGYQVTDKLVVHSALLTHGRSRANNKFRSADLGLGYYYNSPNGFWRLGGHVGAAYGGGNSGDGQCFECVDPVPTSTYSVRYTYAYAQPTVLYLDGVQTWGFGLRVSQAYYHRFTERRAEALGGPANLTDYAGRRSAFIQPTFQYGHRVSRWLTLSGTFGAQRFLGSPARIDDMRQFIGQVGIHFVVSKRTAPQP
ncbi:hypothetical protein [Hymenobacter sp.]|uniref:hypothetical protein n=1 Tax=Hymenobacter sp. TaxID=1898978 RepID=UPI00286A0B91|nr:hypothetical protein [Hymenobacter sp.]